MKKLLCTVILAAMLIRSGAAFAQDEIIGNGNQTVTEPTEPSEPTESSEPTEPNKAVIPPLPQRSGTEYLADVILPVTDIKVGDTVYVNITLNPCGDVYAFEAKLDYDADKLEYKEAEVKYADEDSLKTEKKSQGSIMLAFTQVGEKTSGEVSAAAVLKFSAKAEGESRIILKSFKAVFSDMTYSVSDNIEKSISVSVKTDAPIIDNKPIGGGGGAGGGGGGGKPITSVGTPKPPEPVISDDSDNKSDGVYTDIPKRFWAYDAILKLAEYGIISGYEDGSFRPDLPITRAEFAKIMSLIPDIKYNPQNDSSFLDVSEDKWYYDSVKKAAQLGIISGDADGNFRPESNITREEAAAVTERGRLNWGKYLKPTRENIVFKDEEKISEFASRSVDILYMAEVVNGDSDGYFNPSLGVTRAEAAAMIYRFINSDGGDAE